MSRSSKAAWKQAPEFFPGGFRRKGGFGTKLFIIIAVTALFIGCRGQGPDANNPEQNSNAQQDGDNGQTECIVSLPTTTLAIGNEPEGIAFNPITNRIYVVNESGENELNSGTEGSTETEAGETEEDEGSEGGIVTVIDGNNNSILARINIDTDSEYLAVNEATNRIYVANRMLGMVTVIDGNTNTVLDKVYLPVISYSDTGLPVRGETEGIAVDSVNNVIYIAAKAPEIPQAVEPGAGEGGETGGDTGIETGETGTETGETGIETGETGTETGETGAETGEAGDEEIYQKGHIYVLDGATNTIINDPTNPWQVGEIRVGDDPESIVYNPVTKRLFVANEDDGTVSVVSGVVRNGGLFSGGVVLATLGQNPNDSIGQPGIFPKTCNDGTVPAAEMDEYGEADKLAVNTVTGTVYLTDDQHRVAAISGDALIANSDTVKMLTIPGWTCSQGEKGPNLSNNITVDPMRNRIYVISETSIVTVVDGYSFNIIGTVQIPNAVHLDAVAINERMNLIYITDEVNDDLSISAL